MLSDKEEVKLRIEHNKTLEEVLEKIIKLKEQNNQLAERKANRLDALVRKKIATKTTDALYDWMVKQKYGDKELLHPAVCCDFAGKMRFKKEINKIILSNFTA